MKRHTDNQLVINRLNGQEKKAGHGKKQNRKTDRQINRQWMKEAIFQVD